MITWLPGYWFFCGVCGGVGGEYDPLGSSSWLKSWLTLFSSNWNIKSDKFDNKTYKVTLHFNEQNCSISTSALFFDKKYGGNFLIKIKSLF